MSQDMFNTAFSDEQRALARQKALINANAVPLVIKKCADCKHCRMPEKENHNATCHSPHLFVVGDGFEGGVGNGTFCWHERTVGDPTQRAFYCGPNAKFFEQKTDFDRKLESLSKIDKEPDSAILSEHIEKFSLKVQLKSLWWKSDAIAYFFSGFFAAACCVGIMWYLTN